MFAQGLSGRHNTLSVARPHWMFCVPAPSLPRVFVDAHLSGIFVLWMEKRVILLLRWPSERRRPPPVFNGPAWRQQPDASRRKSSARARHNTLIIITSRHLPGLFCTG